MNEGKFEGRVDDDRRDTGVPPVHDHVHHPTVGTALSKPRWYVLLTVIVSMLLLTSMSIGYTSYVDDRRAQAEREADQRWCVLLVIIDKAYTDAPPTTETGRRLADAYRKILYSFGCVP